MEVLVMLLVSRLHAEVVDIHTRIEGALCRLRTVGDGFCACGLVHVDMRLRCASGLEVETARMGTMALSGSGPDKLILDVSRVEY